MIALNNISLMRGNQLLIADSSLTLSGGQRTGIIGRNGAGKTSLFKALEGEIPLEQGAIELPNGLRTSTMSQETPGSQRSALEFVIDADTAYRNLERALQQCKSSLRDQNLRSFRFRTGSWGGRRPPRVCGPGKTSSPGLSGGWCGTS